MSPTHPRQFAVVASQRTGSTLLIRSLDSSPRIFCAGEIFHAGPGIHHPEHQYPYRMLGSRRLARFVSSRVLPGRIERHVRGFYAHAPGAVDAVGFKLMMSHARTYPMIMPLLQSLGATVIYLLREDTFATALSYYKASRSGVFHSDRSTTGAVPHEVTADPEDFGAIIASCEADRNGIRDLHRRFGGYLMKYEDMAANWDHFVLEIGDRIGVPGLHIRRSLAKLGTSGKGISVLNEDDLRARYASRATRP